MRFLLLFILLISGCATPIETITYKQNRQIYTKSIEDIKKEVFTAEAYEFIKDIPFNDGPLLGGVALAGGSTFLSRVYTTLMLCGWDDQILFNGDWLENKQKMLNKEPDNDSELVIMQVIHEYTHYLDAATRNGEANFIDVDEFKEAYFRVINDNRYHGIYRFTEARSNGTFERWFGVGDHAEHLAWVSGVIGARSGPPYLTRVYRKILKKYEEQQ